MRRAAGAARGAQPGDRPIRRPQEEQKNVSSVADELGMSTDDLKSALKSGSTMG